MAQAIVLTALSLEFTVTACILYFYIVAGLMECVYGRSALLVSIMHI